MVHKKSVTGICDEIVKIYASTSYTEGVMGFRK
jgi:hypothetical protein